jgi:DNA-binding NarL/FixJ family response regulator
LFTADLVILDTAVPGGQDFITAAQEATDAGVLVCASNCGEAEVIAAMQAGAIGFLRKEALTAEALGDAVRAAASGSGVVTPDLLGRLVSGLQAEERPAMPRLTDREQQVLALIAEGHPTREVALQLSYSERTVKNVLHDVVTKLNARSRSQAVAFAVREGLI